MKILLVEESYKFSNRLKNELNKYFNANFYQAFDIKSAENFLEKNRFDLVITDLELKNKKTDPLIKKYIKNNKFIILTKINNLKRRASLFEIGIIDYCLKKIPLTYIIDKIISKYLQLQKNIKHTILIVDNSLNETLKKVLNYHNFKVEYSNENSVIEKIKNINPNLILFNIDSTKNSIDTIKSIKSPPPRILSLQ